MPFHCTTGCAVQQADADGGADDENGRKQRQKQKRKQQFAHAGLRGDGGERGAGDGNAQAAEKEHQKEVVQLGQDRNVVENGEERKHQDFGEQQEKRVGNELGEKNGERIADGKTERAERVVALLAEKTGLQHQRGGEKNGEPEEAGAELARFFGSGADGKAEQDQDDQDENDGGGQEFARTEFRAQFLTEQHGGVGEEAHGGGQALPKVRMERSEAPVFVSATTLPASRRTARVASAEISDSPCRLITMVQPARLSSRSDAGKPGDAQGIEAGGGLIEEAERRGDESARGRWRCAGACREKMCGPGRRGVR